MDKYPVPQIVHYLIFWNLNILLHHPIVKNFLRRGVENNYRLLLSMVRVKVSLEVEYYNELCYIFTNSIRKQRENLSVLPLPCLSSCWKRVITVEKVIDDVRR